MMEMLEQMKKETKGPQRLIYSVLWNTYITLSTKAFDSLKRGTKKWRVIDQEYFFVNEEIGDPVYIEESFNKWEKFIKGDVNLLKQNDTYRDMYYKIIASRHYKKISKIFQKINKKDIEDKPRTVEDLLLSIGITCTYHIEEINSLPNSSESVTTNN